MTASGRNSQEETSFCMCAPRASWFAVHAAEVVMSSTGRIETMVRTVSVGFKPVWLIVEVPRIGCASCGLVHRIELRTAESQRRDTKAFERFILALTKTMTMPDVSRLPGVGRDVVKGSLKRHLHR